MNLSEENKNIEIFPTHKDPEIANITNTRIFVEREKQNEKN
jgi:hypothetical protein